mgnify:FL=1
MTCELRIERTEGFRLSLTFEGPVELAAALAQVVARFDGGHIPASPEGDDAPPSAPRPKAGTLTPAERARRYRQRHADRHGAVTAGVTIVTEPVTVPVTVRDGSRDAPGVACAPASASRSGVSPSLSQASDSSLGEIERESAREGRHERHVTNVTGRDVTGVTVDLDQPMPPWALARVETLRMTLGPSAVDPTAEWIGFVAHVAKAREDGRVLAVSEAGWASWLKRAWDFARRDAARPGPAKASTPSLPSPETLEHREAYEAGLRAAVGQVGFAWSPALDESLREAIRVHAKNRKGQAHAGPVLAEWIRAAASDFGNELRGSKEDPKFLSDGEPKGFLRWLNREEMRKEQRHVDGRAER